MKGLTQVTVLTSTWNEMRLLGLRADGALFRGHVTGNGTSASVKWTVVAEAEDTPPSPGLAVDAVVVQPAPR
ncbi:MAG TPA: hypothetical protein VN323_20895 [Candidatus Dormibacteraeota bacterium]|jgi:hypothetical protein|nr:hypothetical protein [Candidatus Dormibacteraeota bacterium]